MKATLLAASLLLLALPGAVASADAVAASAGAEAQTIRMGRGIGPWRVGQKLATRPGLLRSERYRKNDGPGCTLGPETASRIDYYRGLRLSWSGFGIESLTPFLSDVATSRRGDRSGDGFVIGRSSRSAVRRAHPRGELVRRRGAFALGREALQLTRKTGYEAWNYFTYWFDRSGTLSALQTGSGGC